MDASTYSSSGALDRAVHRYGIGVVLAVARGVVAGRSLARICAEIGLSRRAVRRIRGLIARPVPKWQPSAEAVQIARPLDVGLILVGPADSKLEWPALISEQKDRRQGEDAEEDASAGAGVGRSAVGGAGSAGA